MLAWMGNASAISSPLLQGSGCGQVGAISWSVLSCSSSHFVLMSWSLFACGTGGKGTCFLSNCGTGWSSFNPWLLLDSPFSNFLQPWPLIICRRPFKTPSLLLLLVSPLQVDCALVGYLRLWSHVKLYPRLGCHCYFSWSFFLTLPYPGSILSYEGCSCSTAAKKCMHEPVHAWYVCMYTSNKHSNFYFRRIQFCF